MPELQVRLRHLCFQAIVTRSKTLIRYCRIHNWPARMGDYSTAAIEFVNAGFRLPEGRDLLRDLNLSVSPGETLMLLGRSGSGKTTSLKLINRLLSATAGEVRVDGTPVGQWDLIKLRRRIGYAIQDVGLFPHYSVFENVALIPRLEGWEKGRITSRVEEVLTSVGLPISEFARRYPNQLSGGQRQRVGLARALAAEPPILLMDEPFGALDPITRSELQMEFKKLQQRLGKTVVFVTHDVSEALLLGTRIALMEEGRLRGVYLRQEFLDAPDASARAYVDIFRAGQEMFRS
jgi:osmoprotectant transport system ATP-binding protein